MLNLILFHRVLIGCAIVFCLMFSVYEIAAFVREGRMVSLVLGITFAVLTMGLAWYLRHLARLLNLPPDKRAQPPRR